MRTVTGLFGGAESVRRSNIRVLATIWRTVDPAGAGGAPGPEPPGPGPEGAGGGVGKTSGLESEPWKEPPITPAKTRARGISEKTNICQVLKAKP
jgi:hypothetical protein